MAARKKKNERTRKPPTVVQKRQAENKAKFIEKLKEMPIIQVAAAQVGVHRDTYYEWRSADREFSKACDEALQKGEWYVNDMMESLLIKLAKEGKLTAIIFWLKNHHVQYNDKRYHEHHHSFAQENPLTPERIAQIATVARAWAHIDPDEDERDEDYECLRDKKGEVLEQGTRRWLEENERLYQERMGKVKKEIPVSDLSQPDDMNSSNGNTEADIVPIEDIVPPEESSKKTKEEEVSDVTDKPPVKTGVAKKIKPKRLL